MKKILLTVYLLSALVFIGCDDGNFGLNDGDKSNSGYRIKSSTLDGQIIFRADYNAKGQVIKQFNGGDEATYLYNDKGQIISMRNRGREAIYSYNDKGHLVKLSMVNKVSTFHYNASEQLIKHSPYNKEETNFYYNTKGQLTKAVNDGLIITYSYNDKRQVSQSITRELISIYSYNAIGQLVEIEMKNKEGRVEHSQKYSYESKSCSSNFQILFMGIPSVMADALCKK